MNGIVTTIQRFSLTDGDGIRTTMFLKGCNMRCGWCHNPETLNKNPELLFYEAKCIGCGKCFHVCPNGAHQLIDGVHKINRDACNHCGKCAEHCYAEALVMCGKAMSVEEIMKEIRQDKSYYQNSGGGVTISGGELFCQKDFAIEVCEACHNENISTAVETNLCYDFESAEPLLMQADLIMCDLKLFDSEEHHRHTGVSNTQIMKNIKKLDRLNIPFIVRTPLIPGITDTIENISNIAAYIKGLHNLKRYEILNFNPLGDGKYQALGMPNSFSRKRPLTPDSLKQFHALLSDMGIPYKIV